MIVWYYVLLLNSTGTPLSLLETTECIGPTEEEREEEEELLLLLLATISRPQYGQNSHESALTGFLHLAHRAASRPRRPAVAASSECGSGKGGAPGASVMSTDSVSSCERFFTSTRDWMMEL